MKRLRRSALRQTLVLMLLATAVPVGLMIAQNREQSSNQKRNRAMKRASEQTLLGPDTSAGDYLMGPYTYKNLSIFLIHAKNRERGIAPGNNFLTLQEALEQKKVVVYETKDVNELAIQNLSDRDVYIQSGDIVKGGQQDRMLAVDLIVPPKSGRMPIEAFCVEHGRWSRRGGEQVNVFATSNDVAATKDLKLAARSAKSQDTVWKSVTAAQDKLSENVGTRVNSTVSESSLQLTVENKRVQETAGSYVRALAGIVDGKADVLGYAFAINGKVNSADVYKSPVLFRKLWPKLLKANAIEAIAELQKGRHFEPATAESIKVFLSEAARAAASPEVEVTARVRLVTHEDARNILFESRDAEQKETWIHRNYIRKE